ncbi:hypothetical protein [Virgibacillus pantothenticus]|uniref:hypothetical protein n=1 Tax=Virgibacillus pantothenticus TaxID=1473 RepID=UPI001BB00FD9|nr:hypothetical protein [Virgibacillus pantothenticus]
MRLWRINVLQAMFTGGFVGLALQIYYFFHSVIFLSRYCWYNINWVSALIAFRFISSNKQ